MNSEVPRPAKAIAFPSWLGWSALAAATAFALVAFTLRLGQSQLAARARLAEDAARLAEAELRATQNQLAAERILAAAQTKQWQLADSENSRLRAELQSGAHLAELRIAALSAPAGQSSPARGVAVWDPVTQQGVLTVSQLPALAPDRDYQLWLVDPQYPAPVAGGVFTVDPAAGEARLIIKADKPVSTITVVAISQESKGGAPVAAGPMILLGK